MLLNDYQNETANFAVYPGQGEFLGLIYTTLLLAGEAGETANKVQKIIRDKNMNLTEEDRWALAGELGDALWGIAQSATEIGFPLELIAEMNLDKLESRRARNVIQGSGDIR